MRKILLVPVIAGLVATAAPASAAYHFTTFRHAAAGVVQWQWTPDAHTNPGAYTPIAAASYTMSYVSRPPGYVLGVRCGGFADTRLGDYVPLNTGVECTVNGETHAASRPGAESEVAFVTATELPITICTRAAALFSRTMSLPTTYFDTDETCHTYETLN